MSKSVMELNNDIIASLVLNGDLSKMNNEQRVAYYKNLCDRIGLDPLTQPFQLLNLKGKIVMYASKGATQQLAKIYKISIEVTKTERIGDVYAVTVRARQGDRYTDEIGAVPIGMLKGDALANALMKASTKAKRRAVLALLGLGMLDESELDTPPAHTKVELTPPKEKSPETANVNHTPTVTEFKEKEDTEIEGVEREVEREVGREVGEETKEGTEEASKKPLNAPEKPVEVGEEPQAIQTTLNLETATVGQINAKLRELRDALGEDDFNSILRTMGIDLKKGTTKAKAIEAIKLLESYVN